VANAGSQQRPSRYRATETRLIPVSPQVNVVAKRQLNRAKRVICGGPFGPADQYCNQFEGIGPRLSTTLEAIR
jgi:hypothetical protein